MNACTISKEFVGQSGHKIACRKFLFYCKVWQCGQTVVRSVPPRVGGPVERYLFLEKMMLVTLGDAKTEMVGGDQLATELTSDCRRKKSTAERIAWYNAISSV